MSTPNGEPTNPYSSDKQGQQPYPNQYPQPGQFQGQFQSQNQPMNGYPAYPQTHPEGAQLAQTSMILGIISIFVIGIILGPIAIVKANRAEKEFKTAATVGKVTGWIGTILGVLWLVYIIFMIVVSVALYNSPEFQMELQNS